jgi:2-methylcitrate dehydratase PrpD
LAGLDSDRIAAAVDAAAGLALAPHFESALSGNPVRNLWVGAANTAGLAAARLAAGGMAVPGDTASFTLGQVLGDFDPTPLALPLAERFEILGGYFKRHASCAYTHAPADAILAMRENGPFEPDDVETVTVETFAIAAGLNRTEWPTRLAAMFSIPYVAAATLLDGSFGPEASSNARRADPVLGDLARRVEVKATDEFENRLPERRGARVTVQMHDGSKRSAEVEQPVGDSAHHPLGWDEIRTKLSDLVGTDRTTRLETTVQALPTQPVDTLLEELLRS